MTKKLIDWETFRRIQDECANCEKICGSLDCPLWLSLEEAGDIAERLAEYAEEKYLTPGNPLSMHVGIKQQLLEIAGKKEPDNEDD